jgi:hypothetical protein
VPIPVWLRFDLLGDTWLLSDWAQRSLPEKTEWMAAIMPGRAVRSITYPAGQRQPRPLHRAAVTAAWWSDQHCVGFHRKAA